MNKIFIGMMEMKMGFFKRIAELLGIKKQEVLGTGLQVSAKQGTVESRHSFLGKTVKAEPRKNFADILTDTLTAEGVEREMLLNPKVRNELFRRIRSNICTMYSDGTYSTCSKEELEQGIKKLLSSFPEDDLIGVRDNPQEGLKIDHETRTITFRKLDYVGNIEEYTYSVDDNGNIFIDRVEFLALDNKTLAGEGKCKAKKYVSKSQYDEYGIEWGRKFEQYSNDGTCEAEIRWTRDKEVFCVVIQTLETKATGQIGRYGGVEKTLKEHLYGNTVVYKVLDGGNVVDLTDRSDSTVFGNHCDGRVYKTIFAAREYCKQNPDVVKGMTEMYIYNKLDDAQARGLRKYAEKCGIVFGDKAR